MRIAIIDSENKKVLNVIKGESPADFEGGVVATDWMAPGVPFILDGEEMKPVPKDSEEVKSEAIEAIKSKRDTDMASSTVEHNGKSWTFKDIDMTRFNSKLTLNRDFTWQADDGSGVELTPTVAANIAKKVDDQLTAIFFAAAAEIAAIQGA